PSRCFFVTPICLPVEPIYFLVCPLREFALRFGEMPMTGSRKLARKPGLNRDSCCFFPWSTEICSARGIATDGRDRGPRLTRRGGLDHGAGAFAHPTAME